MKRLFILAVILMAGFTAQAAPKTPLTQEEYLAKRKARAERKGKEYDEAKALQRFNRKDVDGDGILSVEEQTSKKNK